MEDLRIYFLTYNVGTAAAEGDFGPLLALNDQKDTFDFYVISLQEVSAQPHNLLMDTLYEDPWTRKIMDVLAGRYIKIKTIRMQGLVLSVFAKEKHLLNIRDVESGYKRTGFSGMWGNKGAVSIRLGIYGCTICFVNSHLTPHDNQLDDRIDDYNDIIKEQEFHVEGQDKILFHDYIFWMGDLNFRLSEGFEKNPEEIDRMVKKGELDELFKHDQLCEVRAAKKAFWDFNEERPKFAPTFKFEVGETNVYDHKRRPAWCDRILYKCNPDNYENVKLHAEQKSYQSHPYYCFSDHKPVTADFVIKVFADYGEEIIKFHKVTPQWWDNEDHSIFYDITKQYEVNRDDWIGLYKANFTSLDEYETYEYVPKPSSPLPKRRSPRPETKQPHASAATCSSSTLSQSRRENLTFSAPNGKSGHYRVVYISETSDKVRSVLGISEPFEIKEHSD